MQRIQGDQEGAYKLLQGDQCYDTEGGPDLQSDQLRVVQCDPMDMQKIQGDQGEPKKLLQGDPCSDTRGEQDLQGDQLGAIEDDLHTI